MSEFYLQIRLAHVICVCCSGGLFTLRGLMALARVPGVNNLALRWLAYTVDTCLLTAALMLMTILHQYPFAQAWLTVKVLLLVVYVVLGSYALRGARTRAARVAAFLAALSVFLFMASVAYWHDPRGLLHGQHLLAAW